MDALKWIIKTSFILALMFMGLKAEPKSDPEDKTPKSGFSAGFLFLR